MNLMKSWFGPGPWTVAAKVHGLPRLMICICISCKNSKAYDITNTLHKDIFLTTLLALFHIQHTKTPISKLSRTTMIYISPNTWYPYSNSAGPPKFLGSVIKLSMKFGQDNVLMFHALPGQLSTNYC